MFKKILIVMALSFGVASVVGCSGKGAATKTEMTQYVGHLEVVTDKAVTLRNPKNGHVKTFALSGSTSFEVDGTSVTVLPEVVKGDSKNCRITITSGTENAVKVEVKTK